MARSSRRKIQDHAYSARNDSDRALIRLRRLMDIFSPDHPEFLPLLESMAHMQIMFQASLGDFFLHAWGRRPDEFPDLSVPALDDLREA